jgi:alpha-methylacyl-CoA racemase
VSGPLSGVKIIEIAGLGGAPYACMMLADMGAEVIRVDRLGGDKDTPDVSPLLRSRRSMALDLKRAAGRDVVMALVNSADVLIEAFRPGVAERLGIGPESCLARNPRLVYGRLTGWGQTGPMAALAGHDLNYISLAGVLHQIGPTGGQPVVPLNVIGDFGGGGLLMAYGIACALFETRQSGRGQVVDAAMVDGALSFMAMFFGYKAANQFEDRTGAHLLGGGAHYYNVYATADGKSLAVAPIEPQFYSAFLEKLGLSGADWRRAGYPALDAAAVGSWPVLRELLVVIFKSQPRDHWCELFAGSDVCVTPVLTLQEALDHPHNRARQAVIEVGGIAQNAPAPRFSRTSPDVPRPPRRAGEDTDDILRDWRVDEGVITRARTDGALGLG